MLHPCSVLKLFHQSPQDYFSLGGGTGEYLHFFCLFTTPVLFCLLSFAALEAPRYKRSLTNQTVNVTESLQMECDVEGRPLPRLSWFKDHQPLHQTSGEGKKKTTHAGDATFAQHCPPVCQQSRTPAGSPSQGSLIIYPLVYIKIIRELKTQCSLKECISPASCQGHPSWLQAINFIYHINVKL